MISVVLALIAAAGYGVSDFFGGIAARRVTALRVVVVSYPWSVLLVLLIAPLVGGHPDTASMLWGLAAGVASGLAVWWFYAALADGPMAVVSPVTAVLVAGIPVIAGFFLGERPGPAAIAGIALALVAVVLVSREAPDETTEEIIGGRQLRFSRRVALLTVGSGAAFGFAFFFLHETDPAAGLWPLLGQRGAATAVVWICALAAGQFAGLHGEPLRLALWIGVLDVIANAALLYAFHGAMLSVVSVIGSLYPAATVLLAMVLLGERISRTQKFGLVLALAAVAMIAAG
ncbi:MULTISPECIES: EamA family transporter [Nocardia]|uniref:EamA family transporter n=1 Tax=Nocardia coubleae TaxID=356147 RepID=A0A846W4J6_9NOCA|nr:MULTISPECIES: EamA family transporter [Nocardia]MCA2206452.1 DMT family transporter [Nocardia rosealba]NKX88179.1 EamA family transporter [Nocardia coubleae]